MPKNPMSLIDCQPVRGTHRAMHLHRVLIITVTLGLLTSSGCGKDEKAGPAAKPEAAVDKVSSCNDQPAHRCVEYHNITMLDIERRCARSPQAVFADVACPTAGVIGRCTMPTAIEIYYTGAPMAEADLKASCDPRGTYSKP
jgi:hypothetical protein